MRTEKEYFCVVVCASKRLLNKDIDKGTAETFSRRWWDVCGIENRIVTQEEFASWSKK